jgi:phenylacetate-coenzyme A ligase PaaK-like adenylate-forming protein
MKTGIDPDRIFQIRNESEFNSLALEIFTYQSENVPVYRDFISFLNTHPTGISDITSIPFLPVELFKSREIIAENKLPQVIFESSSTTGSVPSRHFVADISVYENSFTRGFEMFYGNPGDYCILALLPSYLERTGSSLVYMADKLIRLSNHPDSGFYLDEHDELLGKLRRLRNAGTKVLLLGVSFSLLDLAKKSHEDLSGFVVMETGGMKGRRKELIREDLHSFLKSMFSLESVHSEYGMTELLSQAYSAGDGIFRTPPWMKVIIRDSSDPFHFTEPGTTGQVCIIDLANIHSCSFLATSDLGRVHTDGSFEILGRIDNSDIRGCNLMIG